MASFRPGKGNFDSGKSYVNLSEEIKTAASYDDAGFGDGFELPAVTTVVKRVLQETLGGYDA